MKIGFDVRMLNYSGIGSTIKAMLEHTSALRRADLLLLGTPDVRESFGCSTAVVPWPVYSLRQHLLYAQLLKRLDLSLFHMPHFDVPLFYDEPFVATIHDLIHLLFPSFSTRRFAAWYARAAIGNVVKKARALITVSDNTKRDLISFFPEAAEKTSVVHNGVDAFFRPVPEPQQREILARHNLEPGYLLYVGNLRPSKNTPYLLKAYEELRRLRPSAPALVLVGNSSYKNIDDMVPVGARLLGSVPREDLPALYSAAAVFVFPSLYEGFGLPPLEAMACGTPVVVSRNSSLPEVCGEAAEYIDPRSMDSFVRTVDRLLQSSTRRSELRSLGLKNVQRFSWSSAVDKTWRIYESCASKTS